jgi:hypothetical protein
MSEEQTKSKRRGVRAANAINAYRRLFSTEDGKTVLADMAKSCFLSRSVISTTPHESYFNEGRRSVILGLLGTINMTEQQVADMVVAMNQDTFEDL